VKELLDRAKSIVSVLGQKTAANESLKATI
jgi:hypothetical protein